MTPTPVEWSERPPNPITYAGDKPQRTKQEFDELLNELKANPGTFAVYSRHSSLGSARHRIRRGRRTVALRGHPLIWRSMHAESHNPDSPWLVLVAWDGDGAAS